MNYSIDTTRFWAKVQVGAKNECWLWNGSTNNKYGHMWVLFADGTRKIRGAHRIAYELVHGQIPNDMCACHRCDVPTCCNPAHIFIGTHRENLLDAQRKGRMAAVRVSDSDVMMAFLLRSQRKTHKQIAEALKIPVQHVRYMIARKVGSHVLVPDHLLRRPKTTTDRARELGISRSRLWQIEANAAGRCQICRKLLFTKTLCYECTQKSRALGLKRTRIKAGIPVDAPLFKRGRTRTEDLRKQEAA